MLWKIIFYRGLGSVYSTGEFTQINLPIGMPVNQIDSYQVLMCLALNLIYHHSSLSQVGLIPL